MLKFLQTFGIMSKIHLLSKSVCIHLENSVAAFLSKKDVVLKYFARVDDTVATIAPTLLPLDPFAPWYTSYPTIISFFRGSLIVQGSPPSLAFICTTTLVAIDISPLLATFLDTKHWEGTKNVKNKLVFSKGHLKL